MKKLFFVAFIAAAMVSCTETTTSTTTEDSLKAVATADSLKMAAVADSAAKAAMDTAKKIMDTATMKMKEEIRAPASLTELLAERLYARGPDVCSRL